MDIDKRSIDKESLQRAIALYRTGEINTMEVGTVRGLCQIHKYLFDGLYDFAGQIRRQNISKGGLRFSNHLFMDAILPVIEKMPESTFEDIISKYVEMHIAHPFIEGNDRALRLWLDQILKKNLGKAIDWQTLDRDFYFQAMERSPINDLELRSLLMPALTKKSEDKGRGVLFRGDELE